MQRRCRRDYLSHGGLILNELLLVKLERLVEQLTETCGRGTVRCGLALLITSIIYLITAYREYFGCD